MQARRQPRGQLSHRAASFVSFYFPGMLAICDKHLQLHHDPATATHAHGQHPLRRPRTPRSLDIAAERFQALGDTALSHRLEMH